MGETKPVLSVGVIFKNEIRCLERCFRSVQHLKEFIPCELVAADTGSDDGSREVAERYADVLIDFPWMNDFSAARNAVIDRACGEWYLSLDADEWFDEDVSPLVRYLRNPAQWANKAACGFTIRNYTRLDLQGDFSDFIAARMFRMSTGIRYEGAIHEHWDKDAGIMQVLGKLIVHHDGYVGFSGERGRPKRERNMALLREKLEDQPDDLLLLLQCVESGDGQEQVEYLRRAVAGVKAKADRWQDAGPPVMRYAVFVAYNEKLPEFEEWLDLAQELFPKSSFVLVDIGHLQFFRHINAKQYAEAIPYGKTYLKALKEYREGNVRSNDLLFSSVMMISHSREEELRIALTEALFHEKRYHEARGMLAMVDLTFLSIKDYLRSLTTLFNLQAQSDEKMGLLMQELWAKIGKSSDGEERKAALIAAAEPLFDKKNLDFEDENSFRHACMAFLPLEGKCWPGDAAALMEKTKPVALDRILARYNDWSKLPITAVVCALERGASFPSLARMEEIDIFVNRLVQKNADISALAISVAARTPHTAQEHYWARTLVIAAIRACPWHGGASDNALVRAFAQVEKRFLSYYYAPNVLNEEGISILPPLHRLGWYCVQAFAALEQGDMVNYVRFLHKSVDACPEMGAMVRFLLKEEEDRRRKNVIHAAPPELMELASQVRSLLDRYPPDDPAVAALKQSDVYQKVAWLIEDPPMLMAGGIAQ